MSKHYHRKVIHRTCTIYYDVWGNKHNSGGAAFVTDKGKMCWWIHGHRHNPIGPAIINPDGTYEFWWHDEHLDEFQFWFRANEKKMNG